MRYDRAMEREERDVITDGINYGADEMKRDMEAENHIREAIRSVIDDARRLWEISGYRGGRVFGVIKYELETHGLYRSSNQKPTCKPIRRVEIPTSLRAAIFLRDGFICVRCGGTERLCIDHITPLAIGGSNDVDNFQTLCTRCNERKGARWDDRKVAHDAGDHSMCTKSSECRDSGARTKE